MGCIPFRTPDGVSGYVCTRDGALKRCTSCGHSVRGGILCDAPLTGNKAGKTCDRFCCRDCATNVGPNRDLCPAHARAERNT